MDKEFQKMLFIKAKARLINRLDSLSDSGKALGAIHECETIIEKVGA